VHTEKMKTELVNDYGVAAEKATVIPFGINSTVPDTTMTAAEARRRLGLPEAAKVVLFFGNIAPYKGLEFLVDALASVTSRLPECHLVIAGRPKPTAYWVGIAERLASLQLDERVTRRIEYVPDEDTEVYFKAADLLALPYVEVFQSGVLFLAYNFGLPVVATDVASLREDVVGGVTGIICEPNSADALAAAIEAYFASPLYGELPERRKQIQRLARERYSWATVGRMTRVVYNHFVERPTDHSLQENV
jgi:glycosyltransferase involved in cell wall biosynthesis